MTTPFKRAAIGALAILGEQLAVLGRSVDIEGLASCIFRNLKWIVPVVGEQLIVRDGARWRRYPGGVPCDLTPGLASIAEGAANRDLDPEELALSDAMRIRGIKLLERGEVIGVLVASLQSDDLHQDAWAILELYALGAAAVLAKLLLIERERTARHEAIAATQSRDDLIASMVHDFRSPLSSVVLSIDCMERIDSRGRSTRAQRAEDLEEMKGSCEQMKSMIDELLDDARISAGAQAALNRTPIDLVPLIRSVVSRVERKSGRSIEMELPQSKVIGDFDGPRLRRVVTNLTENAIKFSPNGGTVSVEGRVDGPLFLLRICDSGIGIPTIDLPSLFQRFSRASNVGEIQGTGVGLATSREIVVLHGGELLVESKTGQGSTFEIRLPLSG